MEKDLVKKLEKIVDPAYVSDRKFDLIAYSRDWGIELARMPDIVITPGSSEEVSRIMKLANKTKTPVCVRGGGTSGVSSGLPRQGGIVLDINRMNRIEEVDEDAMAVTAQAGATGYELIKFINKRGWKISLKPEYGSGVTLAGWASFNGVGLGGSIYGRVGDFILGMEVVLPTGEIVKTGSASYKGARQFNRYQGTGPDLTGLFLNAFGTMGVITEVTFKVYRIPEAEEHISFGCDTPEQAQELITILTKANITYGINIIDDEVGKPFGMPMPAPWIIEVYFEGWKEEVDFRLKKARELIKTAGVGREVPNVPFWLSAEGCSSRTKPPTRMSWLGGYCTLGTTAESMHVYNRVGKKYNLPRGYLAWVSCNYLNIFPIFYYDAETYHESMDKALSELREGWSEIGLTPCYPGPNPDVTPRIVPEFLSFYKKVKKALDPRNIMHRGMSPKVEY